MNTYADFERVAHRTAAETCELAGLLKVLVLWDRDEIEFGDLVVTVRGQEPPTRRFLGLGPSTSGGVGTWQYRFPLPEATVFPPLPGWVTIDVPAGFGGEVWVSGACPGSRRMFVSEARAAVEAFRAQLGAFLEENIKPVGEPAPARACAKCQSARAVECYSTAGGGHHSWYRRRCTACGIPEPTGGCSWDGRPLG